MGHDIVEGQLAASLSLGQLPPECVVERREDKV